MKDRSAFRLSRLSIALIMALAAAPAFAQSAPDQNASTSSPAATDKPRQVNPSDTSNTTTDNDPKRVEQMSSVVVQGKQSSLGGGLMSVQTAPKAVSTITKEAIDKAAPGSNFTQMISSIPGVNSSADDVTGLADGNYSVRGFAANEVGTTVNGAPINDSGSYQVYATEYGDTENYGDITVEQGIPDLDQPDSGAAGGHIAWATINPTHNAGFDFTQSFGSHDYDRTFLRYNTGDTGPVRSWISYSYNDVDKWRGAGTLDVYKIDGKSIWTINDGNSITASLQFNHENRDSYEDLTKAQVAQGGYFADYDQSYTPGSNDKYFYKLHTNPFKDYLFSLDGEFTLSDNLHFSIIPYLQYGDGGAGSGAVFDETTSTFPSYGNANQDLNQDGSIVTGPNGKKALVYQFSSSLTYRPGFIAKFKQDFGLDNSLEYGVWYERPRQEQAQSAGLVDYLTGAPESLWGTSNFVLYPNGQVQQEYNEYTVTQVEKGFLTDTWTPNDHWLFSLGAAYVHVKRGGYDFEFPGNEADFYPPDYVPSQFGEDDVNAVFHKVTPALGIKFSPDKDNQFYYGVGETYRAPPNTAIALNDVTERPANVPESAWNNDLGWRYYGDSFSANMMLYRSNFHDKTVAGYDYNTGETYYTQIDRLRMQGFDAEGSYNLAQYWKLYGSFTYTQARIESAINGGDNGIYPTQGKTLPNTPRNIAYVAVSYDDGHLWGSLNGRYHSSIYGDYMNTESADGYATLGFDAGVRFPDFGVATKPFVKFNIDNITNRKALTYAANGSDLASNPNDIKDANGVELYAETPTYSVLEPRTFMITLGASFF